LVLPGRCPVAFVDAQNSAANYLTRLRLRPTRCITSVVLWGWV